jgi:hypothetical protein
MQCLEVSGAVRHIYMCVCVYIYVYVRQQSVKQRCDSLQAVGLSVSNVSWGSNDAVTLLYCIARSGTSAQWLKTNDSKHYDSHHLPEFPLT